LALQALYGQEAKGLVPLGDAATDASLSAARVESFLAQHFGLGRLLLVAAGELEGDDLARAAKAAFSRTPKASSPRGSERAGPSEEGGVRVDVDDKPALSLAVTAPDIAQALSVSAALEARLARDGLANVIGGHVFMIRGAAVALLRVETRAPLLAVRTAALELERLRREPPAAVPAPPSGDQLPMQTRRLGTRWFAGEAPRTLGIGLGVGMLVAGGRADRAQSEDPDAALREDMQQRAQLAWKEGRALGDPRTTGSSDEQSASVVLENGARIELRRRESEQLVVAVRFAPGASTEPPLLHSRTALLATLTATTCAQAEPRSRLQPLGATLEPRVEAYSWGLLLTAPSAAWQTALSLALDCALHPALERQQLAAARLVLRERLGPQLGPAELRAAAAEVLSPGAPGLIAPWGSPVRQASVSLSALRELWSQSHSGSNVTVSAVGQLPVSDAIGWIARRLSELSPKRAAALELPAKAASAAQAAEAQRIISPTLGLALWRAPLASGADAAGALAFAAAMRAELAGTGMTTSWHDAGVAADGGWAAVSIGAPAEDLALVTARLREIARSLPSTSLERAVDQAFDLAERARASDAGNAAAEAEALAKAPYAAPPVKASREAARALALRLAQAEPIWLPLR
jgi:predicted Zn-dependent peptidase